MTDYPFRADCQRCGHSSDVHRHDDAEPDPDVFRCLGRDPSLPGPPERTCDCPDMLRSEQNIADLEEASR